MVTTTAVATTPSESWLSTPITRIEADFQRSADTHLIALPLPAFEACGIDLYLKDESTHPTGRKVGPSTGTNFVGMLTLANEMRGQQQPGSIVSLLCDAGERYLPTCHDAAWVNENFGDCAVAGARFQAMLEPWTEIRQNTGRTQAES